MPRIISNGLICVAVLCSGICRGAEEEKKKQETAWRFDKNGWIYVHLEGSPDRVGFDHGRLLAPEIGELLGVLKPYLKLTTKRDWAFYRDAAEKILWPRIETEYRRELDGIVAGIKSRGVEADRWDVVALNALEELPYYYVPWLDKKKGGKAAVHSPGNCSAFIATGSKTKDGRIVMGHNAWTNYVVGPRWNIVFDIVPAQGFRMFTDGLPGVIVSDDDFGVNANGIVVTETTISQFVGWDSEGVPEFVRARKALQYSKSIDDYVRIMSEHNNGGYANDWLVGDLKTNEIALFELGLKHQMVKRTKDGFFVGANFPVSEELIRDETTFDVLKKTSSPNARKTRWDQLMKKHQGEIDAELGKKFQTDIFDAIADREAASERTINGAVELSPRGSPEWDWPPFYPGGTVQVKVLDASLGESLSFWACVGHPGAADFIADDFVKKHKEYAPQKGLLKDLKTQPWTLFKAGENQARE